MRSEELAKIYHVAIDKRAATHEIAVHLFGDMSALVKQRKIQTSTGLSAVLKEVNEKWNAVNRRIGGELVKDGFYYIAAEMHPELKPYLPKL